jgi:hypothetical protein
MRDSREGSKSESEIKIRGASIKGPNSIGEHVSLMSYPPFYRKMTKIIISRSLPLAPAVAKP